MAKKAAKKKLQKKSASTTATKAPVKKAPLPPPDPAVVSPGRLRPRGKALEIPSQVLLRHLAVIASSGSGKTVLCKILCEELAERGIPIIAVDPQGDLASLALSGRKKELEENGVDPARARRFKKETEVVVWTPSSSVGIPLSLNPLRFDFSESPAQRIREITTQAGAIAQLIGYDTGKAEGRFARAALDIVITWCADRGLRPQSFRDLAEFMEAMPKKLEALVLDVTTKAKLEQTVRKLHTLSIGAHRLLFSHGLPLDIDTLLGRDRKPREDGKPHPTRISVIYLNTLATEEEKAFFLSELALALYRWMLAHPSKELQAAFYVDEMAPFLPPVRKPACKDALKLLFKQARKYGIACMMATQNPGDVDYKALSQFSTWALGRMITSQDQEKVRTLVRSMAPEEADELLESLPRLRAGSFHLLCPDAFDAPRPFKTRWLLTRHETLDEDAVQKLTDDGLRAAFSERNTELSRALPAASIKEQKDGAAVSPSEGAAALGLDADPESASAIEKRRQAIVTCLREIKRPLTQDEVASMVQTSKGLVAKALAELVENNLVRKRREGRSNLYFAAEYHYHPKAGLLESLQLVPRVKSESEALPAAEAQADAALWFLKREELRDDVRLLYYPLWQCRYTGFKQRGMLIFKRVMQKADNIYMHPRFPDVCVLSKSRGFSFIGAPEEANPLDVKDIDDVTRVETGTARDLEFAEWALDHLMDEKKVKRHFHNKFNLEVKDLRLVFLPIWEFTLEGKRGQRKVHVDALVGKPFEPRDR